jgi:hypothetical protein
MRVAVLVAMATLGCKKESSAPVSPMSSTDPAPVIVGVEPREFQCDSIATAATLTQLLGGPARPIDGPISPPSGLARPCSYLVETAAGPEAWFFDFDCRDTMKQRAEELFAQYERTSSELVEQYAAAADAGVVGAAPPGIPDARPARAPEAARDVEIGARGLDHHGQGLLFLDDDAPCYVRVVGPDADKRLHLARHIATALTPHTAPMRPRAAD